MLRALFSLCLLVLLVVPAPAVRAAAPADYFPLVPGTVWIYRTNIGQDLIMTVGGVGQVGGVDCRVLEGIVNGMLTQRECYRRDGGTVYAYVRAYPQGNVVLTPPQPMLVLPPKVGHGWVWEGKAGEAPARVALQWARAERVTVPAGTYATVQLYLEGSVGQERVQSWRWFAPGVGMVKEDSVAGLRRSRHPRLRRTPRVPPRAIAPPGSPGPLPCKGDRLSPRNTPP